LPSSNCYRFILKHEQISINNNIIRLITTSHEKLYDKKKEVKKKKEVEAKGSFALGPLSSVTQGIKETKQFTAVVQHTTTYLNFHSRRHAVVNNTMSLSEKTWEQSQDDVFVVEPESVTTTFSLF